MRIWHLRTPTKVMAVIYWMLTTCQKQRWLLYVYSSYWLLKATLWRTHSACSAEEEGSHFILERILSGCSMYFLDCLKGICLFCICTLSQWLGVGCISYHTQRMWSRGLGTRTVQEATCLWESAVKQTLTAPASPSLFLPCLGIEEAPVTYDLIRGSSSSEVRGGCKDWHFFGK